MAAPCAMALILIWLPMGCADGPLITTTTAGADRSADISREFGRDSIDVYPIYHFLMSFASVFGHLATDRGRGGTLHVVLLVIRTHKKNVCLRVYASWLGRVHLLRPNDQLPHGLISITITSTNIN